jgi:diguanylate cyclase (GGDEF)-like protein
MLEFLILYVNTDLESSKQLTQTLNLPPDVHFSFTDSGVEALSLAAENKVKLIVLSEHLAHKLRGSEVCELLLNKPDTAAIPIIFLSDLDEKTPHCTNIIKHLHSRPDALELQMQILDTYKYYQNSNELQIEKNLTLSIVNRIHSPIFITNSKTITFANQYFLDFFGLDSLSDFSAHYQEIKDLFVLSSDPKEFSLLAWIKELLTSAEEQKVVMINKDQEQITLKIRGELLEHSNEYLIITQDITSEEQHTKEIEELYNIDHLTRLPNRLKLIKDLDQYDELALAILDIDSFKVINDFYGHLIGDFLIQQVAQRIKNYISHENLLLYRLPSDSFALVNKQNIAKEYFEIIIISLIQIVSKSPFIYTGEDEEIEIFANITGGIVFEKESALAHADLALREAKSLHKDYIIYHDGMRQEIAYKNNMEWVHKIKTAIARDKIIPYFQPIINNRSKKVEKYECLVRLVDEQKQVISPFYFLDIAKQSRLYESITKIMIKKSFQAFSNNHYEFSINLSIEDITDYNLFGYIKSMLNIYPLAERVCFEILETEKIEDYAVISNFVSEVRALGCKVSIDDFGSGYSNFSHLLNLNFDYLKIDATLIKDIHIDKHKQIIVKTIVTFAKELGIKTIGEFVESKEIYDFITQMGIDYSQGYYFSAPVEMIT